jgi:N-acetylmuramoyl-L-alanine amidase
VGLIVFLGCFSLVIVPDTENPPSPKPLFSDGLPTIIIDPGHGGIDEGTQYYHLAEKDITLDTALRLEQTLQSFNFHTVLTRRDNNYVALADRVAVANKIENAVFVSIHFNQCSDAGVGGVETFFATEKLPPSEEWTWVGLFNHADTPKLDNGEALAGFIQASLVQRMDATNRGIKSKALYVVRHTRAPAALIEAGFISNALENQLLRDERYRQRIADSIGEGILNYVRTMRDTQSPSKLASVQKTVAKP